MTTESNMSEVNVEVDQAAIDAAMVERQQRMLDVIEGIREMAAPEDAEQMIQAVAFAMVDLIDYYEEQQIVHVGEQLQEMVTYLDTRCGEQQRVIADLQRAIDGKAIRDVWAVVDRVNVVRVQDGKRLGVFSADRADEIVTILNEEPLSLDEALAEESEDVAGD